MKTREDVRNALEGAEPDDVAIIFLEGLETLIANDPTYFANGRGNSLAHTFGLLKGLIEEASKNE